MSSEFFKRWSERKQHACAEDEPQQEQLSSTDDSSTDNSSTDNSSTDSALAQQTEQQLVYDNDVAANGIEAQDSTSVAALLKDVKADKALKKAALRKLFMQPEFNVVDGLNDYDHDYSAVKQLSVDVAQTLRDWINEESDPAEESQNASVDKGHTREGSAELASDDSDVKARTELAKEQGIPEPQGSEDPDIAERPSTSKSNKPTV